MTREDVIRMAREADPGFETEVFHAESIVGMDAIERFAQLVAAHALIEPCCGNYDQCQKVCMPRAAAAEREAIVQMIENIPALLEFATNDQGGCLVCGFTPKLAIAAIRARGEK